jgi:carboxylate-amine ligase
MRTFGVEEELLLVDARTGIPRPVASPAMVDPDPAGGPALAAELHQEMLEVQSRPMTGTGDLLADVTAGRALADARVVPFGARVVALAMSPLSFTPHPTRSRRYAEMIARYGILGRGTLVCGLHVHIGITSGEEGVAVLDRIRNWLPVLLAISANSPFAGGVDTGYASYRFSAWHQWQSAGPPEIYGSLRAYEQFERELLATEVVMDEGMLYLDARLSRKHPTIEVRIADVCLDARDTVLLAALVRGLVDTAAAEWRVGIRPVATSAAALRLAEWQAALTGVSGRMPHPERSGAVDASDTVGALLAHTAVALEVNGDTELVQTGLRRVLACGGGAGLQRASYRRANRLPDVIADAIEITHLATRRTTPDPDLLGSA